MFKKEEIKYQDVSIADEIQAYIAGRIIRSYDWGTDPAVYIDCMLNQDGSITVLQEGKQTAEGELITC